MKTLTLLPLFNIIFSLGQGIFVYTRNKKILTNRVFALGMISIGLVELGHLLTLLAQHPNLSFRGIQIFLSAEAFTAPLWILFSVLFARSNWKEILSKWKMPLVGCFTVSFLFFIVFLSGHFAKQFVFDQNRFMGFSLDLGSYLFFVFQLLLFLVILINFENTFRTSFGSNRWQIKYFLISLGTLFSFKIYFNSQIILFSFFDPLLITIQSSVLLVVLGIIAFSLVRQKILDVDIFISRYVVYNSLTIFVVGGYLILVGFIAKGIYKQEEDWSVFLGTFFFFLAVLAFAIVALSEKIRLKGKDLITRHFYGNQYDYRTKWLELTSGIGNRVNQEEVATPLLDFLARTIGVNHVTLWIHDQSKREYGLTKSQTTLRPEVWNMRVSEKSQMIRRLIQEDFPFLLKNRLKENQHFIGDNQPLIERTKAFLLIPLSAGKQLVGFLTLGPKISGNPYLQEDLDFLNVIAKQAASVFLNFRLNQELIQTKESEAFHTMSTFLIHDLKNFVSMLSLVTQNAEKFTGNPDFQRDAFKTISELVPKMQQLIQRLKNLSKGIEIHRKEGNINSLLEETVQKLNGMLKTPVHLELGKVSPFSFDPLQMELVLSNLLLNAEEASGGKGEITVETSSGPEWIKLEIRDQGVGMSEYFIQRNLFKPFKTTKSNGFGIGLFQCKQIVGAHGGSIEVMSQVGKGSVFTVILPVKREV